MAAIGVGIIGANPERGWACWAHVPALAHVPDFRLVAVATTRIDSARAAASRFGAARAYADAQALVTDPAVDLVVICVRVSGHATLVEAALDAGKTVFCEWPLAMGAEDAERLAARAEARGLRTAVGLQARAAPVIRHARELIQGGYIGEPLSTTLVGTGNNWGATVPPGAEFILDRNNAATMLTIPFAHAIDALCWTLGDFASLSATTATRRPEVLVAGTNERVAMTAEDQVAVTGALASSAVAVAHYRGGTSRGTNLRWEINGSEGDLVVTGDIGNIQFASLELAGGRGAHGTVEPLAIPERHVRVPAAPGFAFNVAQAYAGLAEDMRRGACNTPDFADAVARHRLIAAVERSAATGARQTL